MTARWPLQPLALAAGLVAFALAAPTAHAGAIRTGDLHILAGDASNALEEGGSSTPFVLRLPKGSTCPGDTANDDWRTQAFLAPEGTDPASLEYNGVGPVGPSVFPMYGVDTRSYRHGQIDPNDVAGEPGHIPAMPVMSYAVFPAGTIPPGRYEIGVACTYHHVTDTYWTVAVDITADLQDVPAQLHWEVVGDGTSSTGAGTTEPWAVIGGLLLVAVALVWIYRAQRSTARSARPRSRKSPQLEEKR